MTAARFFTIGHSTHTAERFVDLVLRHGITAVADVRSIPSSRHNPHFNRSALRHRLDAVGIKYVFLGDELGARSKDPTCYVDGRVRYDRLAGTPKFCDGIRRLLHGAQFEQIAIMCSEGEPLDCHRTVLVAEVLNELGAAIEHIHRDGHLESHAEATYRLLSQFGLDHADLFRSPNEILKEALSRQEQKIAYVARPDSVDVTGRP